MQFDENIAYALGWTVVHSLWQGVIIGGVVGLLFWVLRNKRPNLRYGVGLMGLLAMTLTSLYTFWSVFDVSVGGSQSEGNLVIIEEVAGAETAISTGIWTVENFVTTHISGIVLFWVIGVFFFALKLLGGYFYLNILRKQSSPIELPEVNMLLEAIRKKLNLSRKITVATSDFIQSPLVVGWMKPLVLFPVGLINQLSTKELESILAHELAHVYRLDYLSNILQSIVEVLFYYHPVIWWISSRVRQERESSCDDIAVRIGGDKVLYAKALLALQEYAKQPPLFALSFVGKKKLLLHRIQRILNHPQNKNSVMEKLVIMFLVVVLFFSTSMSKAADSPSASTTPIMEEFQDTETMMVQDGDLLFPADTIPKKKEKIVVEEEGRQISVKMEDGEIQELIINGETIAPESYYLYQKDIDKIKKNKKEIKRIGKKKTKFPQKKQIKITVKTDDDGHEIIKGEGDDKVIIIRSDDGGLITTDSVMIWGTNDSDKIIEIDDDGDERVFFIDTEDIEDIDEEGAERKFYIKTEEMDDMDEEVHRKIEEALEKAELSREEADEILERLEIEMDDEMAHAERGAAHLRMETMAEGRSMDTGTSHDWLRYLIEDGWIENPKQYKVKFTKKSLKINGKKQSNQVLEKCLKLYRNQNGFPLDGKSKVVISRNEN